MPFSFVYLIILGLICEIKSELSLQVIKNVEDFYTPISFLVEEKVGANFSLLCELVSSEKDNNNIDNYISWGKETNTLRFGNESDLEKLAQEKDRNLLDYLHRSEVNKGVVRFAPLQAQDGGKYFCMSLKHMLFKVVQVYVKTYFPKRDEYGPPLFSPFCNVNMFKCHFSIVCIPKHYVCDGKADCKDHSDESKKLCNGDPCKDKLPCEDGRCIPLSWCCDRNHDPNCTVTNRPTCCQLLSEPYEEMEYVVPYNIHSVKSSGGRYLFISVCVLSTFFSVVLLLMILSKVVIFAKKSAYMQARTNPYTIDEITLRQRASLSRNDPLNYRRNFPCDIRTYRNCSRGSRTHRIVLETCEVSNPLLVPSRGGDRPPAYSEVVGEFAPPSGGTADPPPPYTSQEVLNVEDDRAASD